MPARDALGAGEMTGGELFAAAHVDDRHALVDQLVDLGGVDLIDPALHLAEKLSSGGGIHRETPKPRSGFTDFIKYSHSLAPSKVLRERESTRPRRSRGARQRARTHGSPPRTRAPDGRHQAGRRTRRAGAGTALAPSSGDEQVGEADGAGARCTGSAVGGPGAPASDGG